MPVESIILDTVISCLRIKSAEAKKDISLAVFCNETVGGVELSLGV